MKTKSFNVGDKVFAKVKGYPTWPARIESNNGKKYNVYFYGTAEIGSVKPEDLFLYTDYKEKYTRSIRRKDYIDAIEEIEAEIMAENGIVSKNDNESTTPLSTRTNPLKKVKQSVAVSSLPSPSPSKPHSSSASNAATRRRSNVPSEKKATEEVAAVSISSVVDAEASIEKEIIVADSNQNHEDQCTEIESQKAIFEGSDDVEKVLIESEDLKVAIHETEDEKMIVADSLPVSEHTVSVPDLNGENESRVTDVSKDVAAVESKTALSANVLDSMMDAVKTEAAVTERSEAEVETMQPVVVKQPPKTLTENNECPEENTIDINMEETACVDTLTETAVPPSLVDEQQKGGDSDGNESRKRKRNRLNSDESESSEQQSSLLSATSSSKKKCQAIEEVKIKSGSVVHSTTLAIAAVAPVVTSPPEKPSEQDKFLELTTPATIPITFTSAKTTVTTTTTPAKSAHTPVSSSSGSVHLNTSVSNSRSFKNEMPMEEERRDLISRSGRKIKPKKYLDDEEVTENIATALFSSQSRRLPKREPEIQHHFIKEKEKEIVNNGTNGTLKNVMEPLFNYYYISENRIRFLLEKADQIEENAGKRNLTNIEVSENEIRTNSKEILLVKLENETSYIGIKFKLNRPRQFKSELERWQWDKESMKNALEMKRKLEKGECSISDVNKDLLVLDLVLNDDDILRNERLQIAKSKDNRINLLKKELAFVSTIESIKLHLGLKYENVNTKKTIELLEYVLAKNAMDKVILKKHSEILEIVNKLRFYVGNTQAWNLSEEQLVAFNRDAVLIQEKANQLFKYFQKVCHIPESLQFLEEYNKQVSVFNETVKSFSNREAVALTTEPFSIEYFNDRFDDEMGLLSESSSAA